MDRDVLRAECRLETRVATGERTPKALPASSAETARTDAPDRCQCRLPSFRDDQRAREAAGRLDGVDWAGMTHAYGSAQDVPGQIRALCGSDEEAREQAFRSLFCNIFHQGTRYQASPFAVPFLARIAIAGPPAARADTVLLLTRLAVDWHDEYDVTTGTTRQDGARLQPRRPRKSSCPGTRSSWPPLRTPSGVRGWKRYGTGWRPATHPTGGGRPFRRTRRSSPSSPAFSTCSATMIPACGRGPPTSWPGSRGIRHHLAPPPRPRRERGGPGHRGHRPARRRPHRPLRDSRRHRSIPGRPGPAAAVGRGHRAHPPRHHRRGTSHSCPARPRRHGTRRRGPQHSRARDRLLRGRLPRPHRTHPALTPADPGHRARCTRHLPAPRRTGQERDPDQESH
ncbi:hypothetical protein SAMN05428939_0072 [Streptomyces sp. TLI_105]|nr:hypothetical protein SAMN05428939_0072 [Streptomyces sp. TLI_105]